MDTPMMRAIRRIDEQRAAGGAGNVADLFVPMDETEDDGMSGPDLADLAIFAYGDAVKVGALDPVSPDKKRLEERADNAGAALRASLARIRAVVEAIDHGRDYHVAWSDATYQISQAVNALTDDDRKLLGME